jgi:Collagen triple helix repeat (20 copies)
VVWLGLVQGESRGLIAAAHDGTVAAAILTGIAAVVTAWAAVVRAKDKGRKDCEAQLTASRDEAEAAQAALHRIRMIHPEVMGDEGEISPTLLLGLSAVFITAAVIFGLLAAPTKVVHGPPGPIGKTGPAGPTGPTGGTGATGKAGKTAVATTPVTVAGQGPPGPAGPTGPAGPQGQAGVQGVQGLQGLRGAVGATGKPGPTCPPSSSLQQVQVSLKNGFFKTALLCVILPNGGPVHGTGAPCPQTCPQQPEPIPAKRNVP